MKFLEWLFGHLFPPPPDGTGTGTGTGPGAMVDLPALYGAVNRARVASGRRPLASDVRLEAVAARRIALLAAAGRLDHAGYDRDIAAALPGAVPGEVLAAGQTSEAQVVSDWMRDPPHRAELLGNFTLMGAGVARGQGGMLFWCVDFAKV